MTVTYVRVFPNPEHRSSALSQQASMLYVALFFCPKILSENTSMMREVGAAPCSRRSYCRRVSMTRTTTVTAMQIVAKHFNDNWVISVYMGVPADLSEDWAPYRAAREALVNECLIVRCTACRCRGSCLCAVTSLWCAFRVVVSRAPAEEHQGHDDAAPRVDGTGEP